jgi:hypothetical protein
VRSSRRRVWAGVWIVTCAASWVYAAWSCRHPASIEARRESQDLVAAGLIVATPTAQRAVVAEAEALPAVAAAQKRTAITLAPVAVIRVGGDAALTPQSEDPCLVRRGDALRLSLDAALLRAPAGSIVLAGDLIASVEGVEVARAEIADGSVLWRDDEPAPPRGGWYGIGTAVLTSHGPAYGAGVGRSWQIGDLRVAIGAWGAYGSIVGQILGAQIEVGR